MKYGYTRFNFSDMAMALRDRQNLPAWFAVDGPDHRVVSDVSFRSTDPERRFHWLKAGDELYLPALRVLARDGYTGARLLLWLSERGVKVWTRETQGFLDTEMITAMLRIGGAGT